MIEIAGESPISSATWATPQSIWLKTFGCSHNTSDAEFMAGQLHEYGYILLGDEERERAELWLINSCTVKGPSQQAVGNLVKKARELDIAVVVSGCVPQGQKDAAELRGVCEIPIHLRRTDQVVLPQISRATLRVCAGSAWPRPRT